jgi:hypothetical protein
MGQVLHGCATTTHVVRTAIQRSKAPLKELAARYGLNHKTVAKWRKSAGSRGRGRSEDYKVGDADALAPRFANQQAATDRATRGQERGVQPIWLREKLKAGATLEDFAVHKAASRRAFPKRSKKRRETKRRAAAPKRAE